MPEARRRSLRLEARIAPDILAMVRRAAEIQGRSVSDFVVSAAQETAQRTLHDAQIMRLSLAAQEQIADLLLNPPPAGPALERAFQAHRDLISDTK
jgi:uncharacterized protein (DUF1778 family)